MQDEIMNDISVSSPISSLPKRPTKSRLRMSETSFITSSTHHSASPVNSPSIDYKSNNCDQRHYSSSSNNDEFVNSPTPSINSVLFTPPSEKSKYKSRFTEHFDSNPQHQQHNQKEDFSILNEYIPSSPSVSSFQPKSDSKTKKYNQQQQSPELLKSSKDLNMLHSTAVLKKTGKSNRPSLSAELNMLLDDPLLMTTATAVKKQRVRLTSSMSTPLHLVSVQPTKSGSILTSSSSTNQSNNKKDLPVSATPSTSFNRADAIITRLESWLTFLKSIIAWVGQVSKINMMSSRGYYQRAYSSLLDESASFISTTTNPALSQDASSSSSSATYVQQNVNQSILTLQAGLQVLTMQIAAEQQDFAMSLERDHLSKLISLRKECKNKINKLINDDSLALYELLRRAEVTRSKMTHLSRCCKQADKLQGRQPVEMDPWVANLSVIRQLKREVDEENRLRLLMIPIQKDLQLFETRLLDTVKPAVQCCYQQLAPNTWDGSEDPDSAPFQLLLEQVIPDSEWKQFMENHKQNLVDEKNPTKDYLKINYPNKFHPLVMTLLKGKLERKFGVRKQFTERNYVLSQGGYLHEFNMDNKVLPEKTIFIPSCKIIPSIDILHLLSNNMDCQSILEDGTLDIINTFEICQPASNMLQRDKISVFRASTREELITWCRLLLHFSSGSVSLSTDFGITSEENRLPLANSSNTFDNLESHHPNTTQTARSNPTRKKKAIVKNQNIPMASVLKKEEREEKGSSSSGSSPAAMNKRRSALQKKDQQLFAVPTLPASYTKKNDSSSSAAVNTPDTILIPEEYLPETTEIGEYEEEESELYNYTDTASFVTARFNNDEEKPVTINDYLTTQKDNDDDAVSIASTSTTKGHTNSPSNTELSPTNQVSNAVTATPTSSNLKKVPSLASTNFDDAQSSVYFSSTSACPSPSLSYTSSIISIPDFTSVFSSPQYQQ